MKKFITPQENFWASEFGDSYTERNNVSKNISCRTALFSKILSNTFGIKKVLELGANIGHNLMVINNLIPDLALTGVEINEKAVEEMKKIPNVNAIHSSMLEINISNLGKFDLTFTSGALIHINPDFLNHVYEILYQCSNKYILIMEYYNPTPIVVDYRNNKDRLFKRDFAGEILSKYTDLELLRYGFQYHRDNNFPLDDITWFLIKKN